MQWQQLCISYTVTHKATMGHCSMLISTFCSPKLLELSPISNIIWKTLPKWNTGCRRKLALRNLGNKELKVHFQTVVLWLWDLWFWLNKLRTCLSTEAVQEKLVTRCVSEIENNGRKWNAASCQIGGLISVIHAIIYLSPKKVC